MLQFTTSLLLALLLILFAGSVAVSGRPLRNVGSRVPSCRLFVAGYKVNRHWHSRRLKWLQRYAVRLLPYFSVLRREHADSSFQTYAPINPVILHTVEVKGQAADVEAGTDHAPSRMPSHAVLTHCPTNFLLSAVV